MPNCEIDACIARVDAEGMLCRIHQQEAEKEAGVDVRVQYMGDDMAQVPFGTFTKGLVAYIPKFQADKLKGDKDWKVGEPARAVGLARS